MSTWSVARYQRTRSWRSQTSTWRWTAGRLSRRGARRSAGAAAEGGGARGLRGVGLVGGRGGGQALQDQEGVGEPDQGQVAVQAGPGAALVVVEPALPLGVLVGLLDGPAGVGQGDQPRQGRLQGPAGQPQEELLGLPLVPRQGALAQEPADRPGGDAPVGHTAAVRPAVRVAGSAV